MGKAYSNWRRSSFRGRGRGRGSILLFFRFFGLRRLGNNFDHPAQHPQRRRTDTVSRYSVNLFLNIIVFFMSGQALCLQSLRKRLWIWGHNQTQLAVSLLNLQLTRFPLHLMVFRSCLAECQSELDQTDADPNPPQEAWQHKTAFHCTHTFIYTGLQFGTFTF